MSVLSQINNARTEYLNAYGRSPESIWMAKTLVTEIVKEIPKEWAEQRETILAETIKAEEGKPSGQTIFGLPITYDSDIKGICLVGHFGHPIICISVKEEEITWRKV